MLSIHTEFYNERKVLATEVSQFLTLLNNDLIKYKFLNFQYYSPDF